MVDRPRLDQLLAVLARYVTILRQLSVTPLDEFVGDPRNYGSAERFLQLAIGDFDLFAEQITSYADRS